MSQSQQTGGLFVPNASTENWAWEVTLQHSRDQQAGARDARAYGGRGQVWGENREPTEGCRETSAGGVGKTRGGAGDSLARAK